MKKNFKESDFQNLICKYIKNNYPDIPTHIGEAKVSKGRTINFNAFQPQQLPSLHKAATTGLYFKLTDASLGSKPADYIFIRGGYVALMFEIDKQQELAYLVDILKVMALKDSGAKSITLTYAKENGREINLK